MTIRMRPVALVVTVCAAIGVVSVARAAPQRVVVHSPRLGVLNLVGNQGSGLIGEDLKALTPLFGRATQSTVGPPACDVLFIYARVKDSGVVDGSKSSLREIIRDSGAKVVVVATENTANAYIAGARKRPYGSANLVMTLERRGTRFPAFFARLFKMMFDGETMPVAWVKLAPQIPGAEHEEAPGTIFAAEAGQVTFIGEPAAAKEETAEKRAPPGESEAGDSDPRIRDEQLAKEIRRLIQVYVRKAAATSRDKEAIAAMAAVVGERCQEVASEFPVRKHAFVPGQRIFSDRVNVLLAGNGRTLDLDGIPAESVYAQIRDQIDGSRYSRNDFPGLVTVFQGFARRIGKPEDWGKVPLSLPPEDWPRLLPLRVAFDTRSGVDAVFAPIKNDKERALRVSTLALTMLLNDADKTLDPQSTLALVLETINGTAKTAPMIQAIGTPTAAMREAQHKVIKVGGR